MKMIQSSKYLMFGSDVYSGACFTSGPSKGLQFSGTILCGFPTSGLSALSYTSTSALFNQQHSGFYNLNNVEHAKIDGCIIACGSSTKTTSDIISTVFGTTYTTTIGSRQWKYNVLVTPGESISFHPRLEGNFNNCASGFWSFGLGLFWLSADTFVSVYGFPDLEGSSRYKGCYMFTAVTFEVTSTQTRSKQYTYNTSLRVSNFTPEYALSLTSEILRNGLRGKEFGSWGALNINNSINGPLVPVNLPPRFESFDIEALFPSSERNPRWSDLAREAYNSVPFFNGNGIALSADLLGMKSSVTSTTKLIKSLINSGVAPKVVANVFLAFYYGWRLLVMDVGGVSSAFKKASQLDYKQKCSSHLTWKSHDRTYTSYFHCYYNRYGSNRSGIDQLVSMFDAKLSLENIWDMIPFSFVIDWFISVGSLLESIDSFGDLVQDHTIVCTGRSIKCSMTRDAQSAGLNGWLGTVTYSYYKRDYTSYVFFPSLILGDINNPLQHFVEGAALIVSKR